MELARDFAKVIGAIELFNDLGGDGAREAHHGNASFTVVLNESDAVALKGILDLNGAANDRFRDSDFDDAVVGVDDFLLLLGLLSSCPVAGVNGENQTMDCTLERVSATRRAECKQVQQRAQHPPWFQIQSTRRPVDEFSTCMDAKCT